MPLDSVSVLQVVGVHMFWIKNLNRFVRSFDAHNMFLGGNEIQFFNHFLFVNELFLSITLANWNSDAFDHGIFHQQLRYDFVLPKGCVIIFDPNMCWKICNRQCCRFVWDRVQREQSIRFFLVTIFSPHLRLIACIHPAVWWVYVRFMVWWICF